MLSAVMSISIAAIAQQATNVGTITDPSGAALLNVNVTVTNLDSNAVKQIQTETQFPAGPRPRQMDLSLFKSFVFNEARGSRFELRAESFNTWNHTEFTQVSNGLGSSNFGQVTSAFDPRVFQFGAKLYF